MPFRTLMMFSGLLAWAAPALAAAPSASLNDMLAAGEIALFTCSGTFTAGRPLEGLRALELTDAEGEPKLVGGAPPEIAVDRDQKRVSVPVVPQLPPMVAAYRPDLGCSVLPVGAGADLVARLPRLSFDRSAAASQLSPWWPAAPEAPGRAGATRRGLLRVVDRAFEPEAYGRKTRTLGIVVLQGDRLLVERYRDGFGPKTSYRTWSMAKSIAATLIGVAIQDGLLASLDEPLGLPEWQGDPRGRISIDQALTMRSGLSNPDPEVAFNTEAAYWLGIDTYADLLRRQVEAPPGTRWTYANYDTLLLMAAVRNRLPDRQAYLDFPYRRLFHRIGMVDTVAETDAWGNYVMSSQVYSTPRDLARLVRLYRDDGVWNGERILPAGWTAKACTEVPESRAPDLPHVYGRHWWIETVGVRGRAAPVRVCYASGARGQFAALVPEYDAIIVRTSVDGWVKDPERFDRNRFFADLLAELRPPSRLPARR